MKKIITTKYLCSLILSAFVFLFFGCVSTPPNQKYHVEPVVTEDTEISYSQGSALSISRKKRTEVTLAHADTYDLRKHLPVPDFVFFIGVQNNTDSSFVFKIQDISVKYRDSSGSITLVKLLNSEAMKKHFPGDSIISKDTIWRKDSLFGTFGFYNNGFLESGEFLFSISTHDEIHEFSFKFSSLN